jgi:hypothetical protein
LDFELLQYIGISPNARFQQRHLYQQEDGFSYGPLVVAIIAVIAYQINLGDFIYNILEPLQTTGDWQQKEVQRSGSWRGKDKTIHLFVFSPHGFKLFLLLPLHFHTRTSGSDLMPVANQCKPNRISFHP